MIKLKDILGEDFGGSYGGNKNRGKFYKGGPNNDEPFDFRDDKTSRPTLPTPKEWDKLMDRVNNDPRFETYTGKDGYQIKDTRGPSSNLKWQLTPGRFSWSGIGRASAEYPNPREFNDVKELIKNFYEVTGLSPDSAVSEQTTTGDPDDFGLTSSDPAMKKFPAGTSFFELTERTGTRKLQIAFIEPRNAKGPFKWTPYSITKGITKGHMQTIVKIECREGDANWEPGKIAWVSGSSTELILVKLDNGTKLNNFVNKDITRMFAEAYSKHKSTSTPDTLSADI